MPGMKMCIKLTLLHINGYNSFIILYGIFISYYNGPPHV